VIGGEQVEAVRELVMRSVGEAVLRFASDDAGLEQIGEVAVEGNLSEGDDDADSRQGLDFAGQVRGAVAEFLGGGFVSWRRAADDGGDPGMAELQAVVAGDGLWFGGKAELVEDRVHEVAGAVAGEGAAGAVGSMGAGGEAKDEDAGARVSEAGNRTAPVGLVLVGAAFGLGDALAVGAESGTALTGDDGMMNLVEDGGRNLCAGGFHCIP